MATGRDASVGAITTYFGIANLTHFTAITEEQSPHQATNAYYTGS
ncbi:MAG: hypothetical protein WB607_29920 [Candidatus Acidiferrum sp.]|jgi:hypothetical protein